MKKIVFFILFCLLGPSAVFAAAGVVNISYVKSPFNLQAMVMKNKGILEKELAPLGLKPVWHEINSGAQQAQAMAAGSLDVASVINTTSAQMARAEGNPIKLVAAVSRPVDIFAIVAAKDGPQTIKDLQGKIVAGPKGTVLHQILAAALQKEGLTIDDIQFIQMDIPKAFAALESKRADAALLAANALINAQQAGNKVLTTAHGLAVPKLGVAASENFINNNPKALQAVIDAHDKAWDWIQNNHREAMALGAREQNISEQDAEDLFNRSHFSQRFTAEDSKSMEEDQKFMLENGMMRHSVKPEDLILPQAMQ